MADPSPQSPALRCPVCGSSGDDNWENEDVTMLATPVGQARRELRVRLVRCLACDHLLFFARSDQAQP
jgi:hypothetical protein